VSEFVVLGKQRSVVIERKKNRVENRGVLKKDMFG
jgi:hypothetical protein